MSSLLKLVLQDIEPARRHALLLQRAPAAALTLGVLLLSMDNNCSLFAGQLIYHKRAMAPRCLFQPQGQCEPSASRLQPHPFILIIINMLLHL